MNVIFNDNCAIVNMTFSKTTTMVSFPGILLWWLFSQRLIGRWVKGLKGRRQKCQLWQLADQVGGKQGTPAVRSGNFGTVCTVVLSSPPFKEW